MDSVELIRKLCKEKNISIAKLERDCGFSNGYIRGLRRGVLPSNRASIIAEYLGVSLDFLTTGQENSVGEDFSQRDERDIKNTINSLMEKLDSNDGAPLYFDGQELSPETKMLFEAQLDTLVRTVKKINKEKYNPNKNKE